MENKPINYEEKVVSQTELVKKLSEDHKAAPSDEKKLKIQKEMELLRHYSNAVKGDPKERSKKVYNEARNEALSKAIEPVGEENAG